MSIPNVDPVATGSIRFLDNAIPALTAGKHRITVTHEVDVSQIPEHAGDPQRTYAYEQTFHVEGSRFGLTAADVHAVFPPPNSQGSFGDVLPHAVFRRRTLPWERRIDSGPANDPAPAPWFALLSFREGEAPTVVQRTIADVRASIPGLTPSEAEDPANPVLTIDVPPILFSQIAPLPDELKLLAHVRQVKIDAKELTGQLAPGWFSVAICNRTPGPGLNTVHLVSLEGWHSALETLPAGLQTVRLVSLMSWSFTSRAARGSFKELTENLDRGSDRLRMPAPESLSANPSPEANFLKAALSRGYVPLTYEMRQAENTTAWYRGPLLPVVVDRVIDRDPFPSQESGMIYDSRTGMFDLSLGIAWQIGRLLALSDSRFTAALSDWRLDGQRDLDKALKAARLDQEFDEAQLWAKIGEITAAAGADLKRQLAEKLLADLADPVVFSSRLGRLVLNAFESYRAKLPQASGTILRQQTDASKKLADKASRLLAGANFSVIQGGATAAAEIRRQALVRRGVQL